MTRAPMLARLPALLVEDVVAAALREDLGDAGDISTNATVPEDAVISAHLNARNPGVIAGIDAALAAFALVDPEIDIDTIKDDGTDVVAGDTILAIHGPARGILTGERVALNFLCHLSGIATATRALVDAVAGNNAAIVGTRKTTPGLRAFEKHAVKCGGGKSHRYGLYDAVMIKDNHIVAAGGIASALTAARNAVGHMVKIEIEIDELTQLDAALEGGADVIMLDNMAPADMRKAVERVDGKAILEASGNVTLETVRAIAQTGVDVISSGWITHSAPNLDLGLDFFQA